MKFRFRNFVAILCLLSAALSLGLLGISAASAALIPLLALGLAAAFLYHARMTGGQRLGGPEEQPWDYELFANLLERAQMGDAAAQNNLGRMFLIGSEVERNPSIAAFWFEKAARAGLAQAQFNLGLIYYRGDAGASNLRQAASWFRLAAQQGDPDAIEFLQRIAARRKPRSRGPRASAYGARGADYGRRINRNRAAHEILGVSPDATLEEINAAFRTKAKQYHPDLTAALGPESKKMAEDMMKAINQAHDELVRGTAD
ncbi:MAG: J domain-containing protein [Candidatus Binataceae bacterium]